MRTRKVEVDCQLFQTRQRPWESLRLPAVQRKPPRLALAERHPELTDPLAVSALLHLHTPTTHYSATTVTNRQFAQLSFINYAI
jgi:hypothetical protein